MRVRTLSYIKGCLPRPSPVSCNRYRNSSTQHQPPRNGQEAQSSVRTRLLLFAGGFLTIHLSVVFARRFYKKKETKDGNSEPDSEVKDYYDPDIGKSKIVQYKGYLFPYFVKDAVGKLEKFPIRDDDVIVASFPKSGTTWVQEIVYLIETGLDFETAQKENMEQRFPYIEFVYPGIDEVAKISGRRWIKTHMPFSLLPVAARSGRGKIVYIARNPKDVTVSNFHFVKMLTEINYKGDFFSFFEKFVNDKVPYGPWWKHVLEYWENRNNPNILFLTYEELKLDLPGSIKKVAEFLGKDLDEEQIMRIADHCGFEAMKRNPSTNYTWWNDLGMINKRHEFMRKGVVGDWKNYYTKDMQRSIDSICQEKLCPHGLIFQDRYR